MKKTSLYIVLFLFFLCGLTFGAEKEKIAVANFDAKMVSPEEAEIVANFLRSDLVNAQAFVVLDRNNMDKILDEQKFQKSGCTSMECAVEIGKILNVRKMVVGTLSKLGTFYYLEVSVVDVETSAIVLSLREKCNASDEIEGLTKKIAEQLSGVEIKRPEGKLTGINDKPGEYDLSGRFGISGQMGFRQGTSYVLQGVFYGCGVKIGILSLLSIDLDVAFYNSDLSNLDLDVVIKYYSGSTFDNFHLFAGVGPSFINRNPDFQMGFVIAAGLEYFVNRNLSFSIEVPIKYYIAHILPQNSG